MKREKSKNVFSLCWISLFIETSKGFLLVKPIKIIQEAKVKMHTQQKFNKTNQKVNISSSLTSNCVKSSLIGTQTQIPETQLPQIREPDLVGILGSIHFYKQIFECKVCFAKFTSRKQMEFHFSNKHSTYKRIQYRTRIINEKYIQERLDLCKTRKLIFKHHPDPLIQEKGIDLCDHQREILNSCYLRICEKCEATRRYRNVKKYKNVLLNWKRVSVVTLTVKDHHPLSKLFKNKLEQQIRNFMKRLERHFRNVKISYIRVLEIVKKSNGWYYHFHILMDLPFLDQKNLSKMWYETSGSKIVYIQILKDRSGKAVGISWNRLKDKDKINQATNYITKYLAKPVSKLSLDQYARIIYRSHLVETKIDKNSLTCLNGQNSAKKTGLICEICKETLFYDETREIDQPCT